MLVYFGRAYENKMAASTATPWLRRSMYCYTRSHYLSNCLRKLAKYDDKCGFPIYRRCSSYTGDPTTSDPKLCTSSTFESMVRERRRRSRNSVLIHVFSKLQVPQLRAHCQKYGPVQLASHYSLGNEKDFVFVEFEKEDSVLELLRSTYHFDDETVIPVHSRYLWYKVTESDDAISHQSTSVQSSADSNPSSAIHYETRPTAQSLLKRMQNANSVSEQMMIHHETVRLTELGQQLRFFVCHQLETAFSGMFSHCVVLPYGSSVNGFGKFDGDLDMVLTFENSEKRTGDSQLLFHTKRSLANGRAQSQRYLDIFGDIISSFFPGCSAIQRILNARVPIVKFQQELVNLECDLSMSNLSGVYMSELLYLYGELDARVRPLVSTVLRWAKVSGLTHENPGRWITNFTLILMVAVFLQCRPQPILPSLSELQRLSGSSDRRISEQIDCTFLRDLDKFPKLKNSEDLGDLLVEFFTFYVKFNFRSRGLSLIAGKDVGKRDHSPLYVQNPLQVELNVSQNVSGDEVIRISEHMEKALWTLESSSSKDETWGLAKLLSSSLAAAAAKKFQVSDILSENSKTTAKFNVDNNKGGRVKVLSANDLVGKLRLEKLMQQKTTNNKKKLSLKRRASRVQPRPWTF